MNSFQINEFIWGVFGNYYIFAYLLLAVIAIIAILILIKESKKYKSSAYYQITHNSYFKTRMDLGKYGEYLTYKNLKIYEEEEGKFLFNLYIPKENDETTEIDVLMICTKGIFVIESKNYSGWIFGSEYQKQWVQTLPTGRGRSRKEYFFNPILQNKVHIKWLKTLISNQVPIWSIVAFSDRCTLKKIDTKSNEATVIKRCKILAVIDNIFSQADNILSIDEITTIYNTLYPYTQTSHKQKIQHISDIKTKNASFTSYSHHNENAKCPICKGNLILKTSKKGTNSENLFYGCSNYPKCRYIENL